MSLKGKRKKSLNRRKNGTFGPWKGGRMNESHHGVVTKIGMEFKRQFGKVAQVGDTVRRKNNDGSFNKGSPWYVKTSFGWRPVKKKES